MLSINVIRVALAGAMACSFAGLASAASLSTGAGDGSVTVGVDGYGSFGSSVGGDGTSDAFYDPVGPTGAAGTTYQSGLAVGFGGSRPFLTTGFIGDIPNVAFDLEILNQTATSLSSQFRIGPLAVTLEQSLFQSFSGGQRTGSVLNQVYEFTNIGQIDSVLPVVPTSFDVVRYLDGDLDFDGTIDDGGGRILRGGSQVLFEVDATGENDESSTFVGITGNTGNTPSSNRFEIASYSGLLQRVEGPNPPPLRDTVDGDFDNDGFIDVAYDVTLALRDSISLDPFQSQTYTTQTLFGNALPPAPGSSESLPLLPSETSGAGTFIFDIETSEIDEGELFWIDPEIAVGYTYEIIGAEFDKVGAPSFAAVADADGYVLTFFDGVDFVEVLLDPEEMYAFDTSLSITEFTITGIDTALMLDPDNALAFVTGVAYRDATSLTITVTQTPIREDLHGVGAVPLPAGMVLMVTSLVALGGLGARRTARRRDA